MENKKENFTYILDWGALSPYNHMRLVNRCYPANPTEKSVPRSNKLATLIFYLNARPAKLVKISKFLAYKIQIDVTLKHHGYVYHCVSYLSN